MQREVENYAGLIARARLKMCDGNYLEAKRLLALAPEGSMGWEWGRLQYLCNLDLRTFGGQGDGAAFALSNDGRRFLTLDAQGTVRVWSTDGGRCIQTFTQGDIPVADGIFSGDGAFALILMEDGSAELWDTDSGERTTALNGVELTRFTFEHLRLSPNGQNVLVDGVIRETGSGKELWRVEEEQTRRKQASAEFSPDGRALLVWSERHRLDKPPRLVVPQPAGYPIRPAGHPQPRHLVDVSLEFRAADCGDAIWNVTCIQSVFPTSWHRTHTRFATFTPDGSNVVLVSSCGAAVVLNTHTGTEVRRIEGKLDAGIVLGLHPQTMVVAMANADVPKGASRDYAVTLWTLETGERLSTFAGHSGEVRHARFSPTGDRVYTIGADGTVKEWSSNAGQESVSIPGGSSADSRWSRNGHYVATGFPIGVIPGLTAETPVAIWDAVVGRQIARLGDRDVWALLRFSADGRRLLYSGLLLPCDVYTTETGAVFRRLKGRLGDCATLDSEGRRVAEGYRTGLVVLSDVDQAEKEPIEFTATTAVLAVAFSPDGRRLLAGCADGALWLWDIGTGECLHSNAVSTNPVSVVGFSPDSRFFFGKHTDGTTIVRKAESHEELLRFTAPPRVGQPHADRVPLAFSPDGQHVLAIRRAGQNEAWHASSGQTTWYSAETGQVEAQYPTDRLMTTVAFSPDGRRAAIGGRSGGLVRLRDSRTGTEVWSEWLHTAPPTTDLRTESGDLWGIGVHFFPKDLAFGLDTHTLMVATPNRVAVLPAFPWKKADYPGGDGIPLEDRVELYKRAYWRQLLSRREVLEKAHADANRERSGTSLRQQDKSSVRGVPRR